MKSNFLIGPRRLFWNRKRKFFIWLSELALDYEGILQETKLRNKLLRKLGMKIGKGCVLGSGLDADWPNVIVGDNVKMGKNVRIWGGVTIEDNVVLSEKVQLITAGHEPEDMSVEWSPIVIRKGAWIATSAIVLSGAEIGEGACVAAGAVVCRGGEDSSIYRCSRCSGKSY